MEVRTHLRTSALSVIRYESAEWSERKDGWCLQRECDSCGEVVRELSPKENER